LYQAVQETEKMFSTKAGATKLLIGVVVGLIIFKVVVSWLTGSISILAYWICLPE